jgi:prevent-host-death family protein
MEVDIMEVTSTEAQNNFGQYMKFAFFEDIIVTRNGKRTVVIKAYKEENEADPQVREMAESYKADHQKITYEEFLMLSQDSENRYEYIDGEVYLLASPTYDHQSIIMEMSNQMYQWFKGKKCRALTAPFDVTLIKEDDKNVVQPDIIVICDTENVNEKGRYMGVPSLVAEVLSESTRRKDMIKKLDLYLQSGVREYWVVNPFNREVHVYCFSEDKDIMDCRTYKGKETAFSVFFKGLEIPLEQIFST